MRTLLLSMTVTLCGCLAGPLPARGADEEPAVATAKAGGGPTLGPAHTQRWRLGMIVTASGGPCSRLTGTTTVPMDWPEQQVKVVAEDLSPGVTVSYKSFGTAKQMIVKIAHLAEGQEARAILTIEIRQSIQVPPEHTDGFTAPNPKSLRGSMKDYLTPSPLIESNNLRIKALAKQIGGDAPGAWSRVRAIYDWVRKTIHYEKDAPLTGVVEAIDQGSGDCNELTSAFVAICRAGGIPARTVRIPHHCYPEFYLQDDKGQGCWFPAEVSGSEAFGGIPARGPILQKGDNFRLPVPDPATRRTKIEVVRFLPETLVGLPKPGGGQPQMRLICEPVRE
jgi:hypothetical protein